MLAKLDFSHLAQGKKKRPSPKKSARGTEVQIGIAQAVDHFLTRSDRLEKRRRRKFQRRRAKQSQKCAPEANKTEQLLQLDSEELIDACKPAKPGSYRRAKGRCEGRMSRFSAAKSRLLCQNELCQAEINGSHRTGLAGPTEPSHLVCCLCGLLLQSDAFSIRKPLLGTITLTRRSLLTR